MKQSENVSRMRMETTAASFEVGTQVWRDLVGQLGGDCEHDGDGWLDVGYGEEVEGNAEGNVYRESEEHGVKILENISFVRLRSPF